MRRGRGRVSVRGKSRHRFGVGRMGEPPGVRHGSPNVLGVPFDYCKQSLGCFCSLPGLRGSETSFRTPWRGGAMRVPTF